MNKNIDPKAAEREKIQLDQTGWPTPQSLKNWHEKNNQGQSRRRTVRVTEEGEKAAAHSVTPKP